jgi:hypothetical protein
MDEQRITSIELRSLPWNSIGGVYMGLGSAFSQAFRFFHVQNLTNRVVVFSHDGINDAFYLPVYGYQRIDCELNKGPEYLLTTPVGMRWYARLNDPLDPPTIGSVDITCFK